MIGFLPKWSITKWRILPLNNMEEKQYNGLEVVKLFLEKIELLTDKERQVIIKTIDILNNPLFITKEKQI
jgi:hypothetical protein